MNVWFRTTLILVLLITLGWSLVAFTSVPEVPTDTIRNAETTASISDPADHVGERVVVDGTVVGTDPIVIEMHQHNSQPILIKTIEIESDKVAPDDRLYVFGELTEPDTVRADRVVIQKPWERQYTLIVSFIGGLLVLGRFFRDWRYRLDAGGLVPRTNSDEKNIDNA